MTREKAREIELRSGCWRVASRIGTAVRFEAADGSGGWLETGEVSGDDVAPTDAGEIRERARDAVRRGWTDARGDWIAEVDRVELSCGGCDPARFLHVTAPDGNRETWELRPGARLGDLTPSELSALASPP